MSQILPEASKKFALLPVSLQAILVKPFQNSNQSVKVFLQTACSNYHNPYDRKPLVSPARLGPWPAATMLVQKPHHKVNVGTGKGHGEREFMVSNGLDSSSTSICR